MRENNLLNFLFGESQQDSALSEALDHVSQLLEADADEPLAPKKSPLAAALKSIGIDAGTDLQLDPEGLSLTFENDADYHAASAKFNDPDTMEKLAELGWVAHKLGDSGMCNEPAEYRIRFIEIGEMEPAEGSTAVTVANIIKAGREFATTPVDHSDDKLNPIVRMDKSINKKHAGMGDAKDGAKTDHAIHGGKSKSEALDQVNRRLNRE